MKPQETHAAHMERVRAVQAHSRSDPIVRRLAYLEHHDATLTDDERRQLKAVRALRDEMIENGRGEA